MAIARLSEVMLDYYFDWLTLIFHICSNEGKFNYIDENGELSDCDVCPVLNQCKCLWDDYVCIHRYVKRNRFLKVYMLFGIIKYMKGILKK